MRLTISRRKSSGKTIEVATANADIVKQEREIELKQKRGCSNRAVSLEAEVKKKAEANKYAAQQQAEAQLYQRQKEAEARQFEAQRQAEAQKAEAEAMRYAQGAGSCRYPCSRRGRSISYPGKGYCRG